MNIYNVGNRIMNTYVYHSSYGYVMVDTGYEHSLKSVTKKLKRIKISLQEIKYVFLTHAHDDHAGFLNELLHKNKDIKVIISDKSMPLLKKGQNSFEGGCSTFLALMFCKVMELLGRGQHVFPYIEDQFNDRFITITDNNKKELEELLQGKILFTPGHTSDSISLKKENIVFCGDAAMNGFPSINRIIIWIENIEQFEKSWEILINEDIEYIYPAHGKPFKKDDLKKYKNKISKVSLRILKK